MGNKKPLAVYLSTWYVVARGGPFQVAGFRNRVFSDAHSPLSGPETIT